MSSRTFEKRLLLTASAAALSAAVAAGPALAQGATDAARDTIIITATKRAGGVDVQDTPIAVTAYGEEQLDALHFRDLKSLSFSMPNVQLEDIGTVPGTANFSIRGIGVNSSIPSIDPTVGVFVDGLYMGVNAGVVFNNFDLEGIEVLRGPQGVLFGRNVTGGAVILRTKQPSDTFTAEGRVAIESGLNYFASGGVSGPVIEDGSVKAKLALYYNNDEGYFENLFDGNDNFGESETVLIRPAVTFQPNDSLEVILRYEHGETEGDGPAAQNHINGLGIGGRFDRESFDFSVDETGLVDSTWDQGILEANLNVPFGDGVVTNIAGYRTYESDALGDIDATPDFLFHSPTYLDQEQFSNELRYAGTFGRVDVTSGVYYFNQTINYVENRLILGGLVNSIGGGVIDHQTVGVFSQFDIRLTDQLTLNVGGRYTEEEKDAVIQTVLGVEGTVAPGSPFTPAGRCVLGAGCSAGDFVDGDDWTSFGPKVGAQWQPNDDTQAYVSWGQAYRSGGYNLRNTLPVATLQLLFGPEFNGPGPFDQEEVTSIELGVKQDFLDGRGRLNAALFRNTIDDMQREVNLADPNVGVVQVITNTADATIQGFEAEGQFFLTDDLLVRGQLGYTDGEYDEIFVDLTGDRLITDADLSLDIPRLAPWTYGASVVYDYELGEIGTLSSTLSFNHRDSAAYTDNNLGFFNDLDMLDFNVALARPGGGATISVFGKNLLDEVNHGNDTQLPSLLGPVPLGGTFAPLVKGRVFGAELVLRR